MSEYALPSGRLTRTLKTYHREWSTLADAVRTRIAKATGSKVQVISYDPGISLYVDGEAVVVPVEAAITIQKGATP